MARMRHADTCQQCRVAEMKRTNATVVATAVIDLEQIPQRSSLPHSWRVLSFGPKYGRMRRQ